MRYELFIAKRYLTARRKQAFISVITFISVLGITIGVMALVIALALISGFQADVQNKILGTTSHLMISSLASEGLEGYPRLIQRIEEDQEVLYATPVVYDTVLLNGPFKSSGVVLRGLDLDQEVKHSAWLKNLREGALPREGKVAEILLGSDVAFRLGATVGEIVTVITASARLSPVGPLPRMKKFRVAGIFHTGLYEYDSSSVIVPLSVAQDLFRMTGRVNLIQVKIKRIFEAEKVKQRLQKILPMGTYITTWMELNKSLFSALKLEKKLMFFTIALIVLVAALNIIATLILMVMEKTRDIGILMAMGATAADIRRIFFYQGAMIGFIGTFLGVLLGVAWCWLANTFQLIRVPVEIYQIAYVPFRLQATDLTAIILVSLLISLLSTLFPSYRAAKIDPVVALKYE
ncbi:MAG: ABC transporter permease [Candidatus Aminicenantes bacterium]|nr:ABC transporter permease [Candidatus Aminicenantes bacterium]